MEKEEAGDPTTGGDEGLVDNQGQQQADRIEFFEGEGSGGESDEGEGGSPDQVKRGKDSDSTRGAFVTLSPSISPGKDNIQLPAPRERF